MNAPHRESVLSRAARIPEAFSQDEPTLAVSGIARRTGLHAATASRLVGELVAHGPAYDRRGTPHAPGTRGGGRPAARAGPRHRLADTSLRRGRRPDGATALRLAAALDAGADGCVTGPGGGRPLLLNRFFAPPVRTLTIADPKDTVAVAVFVGPPCRWPRWWIPRPVASRRRRGEVRACAQPGHRNGIRCARPS
ncbi:hypothetical protein SUDANB176_05620 [Streptomyces sp. enrichment culture]